MQFAKKPRRAYPVSICLQRQNNTITNYADAREDRRPKQTMVSSDVVTTKAERASAEKRKNTAKQISEGELGELFQHVAEKNFITCCNHTMKYVRHVLTPRRCVLVTFRCECGNSKEISISADDRR